MLASLAATIMQFTNRERALTAAANRTTSGVRKTMRIRLKARILARAIFFPA
jgi:hypothetical protein